MSAYKNQLDADIKEGLDRGDAERLLIRRLFGFNPAAVLASYRQAGFAILNAVAEHFAVPFRSIYIAGSVQTGYSYFRKRDFIPKDSDIDLAIVDPRLYQRYAEIAYKATSGFNDLTRFPVKDGVNQATAFKDYMSRGYFRPDLMPAGPEKQDWFRFFNRLGRQYIDIFESVNAGIYLSEVFFETKQTPLLRKYKEALA